MLKQGCEWPKLVLAAGGAVYGMGGSKATYVGKSTIHKN